MNIHRGCCGLLFSTENSKRSHIGQERTAISWIGWMEHNGPNELRIRNCWPQRSKHRSKGKAVGTETHRDLNRNWNVWEKMKYDTERVHGSHGSHGFCPADSLVAADQVCMCVSMVYRFTARCMWYTGIARSGSNISGLNRRRSTLKRNAHFAMQPNDKYIITIINESH